MLEMDNGQRAGRDDASQSLFVSWSSSFLRIAALARGVDYNSRGAGAAIDILGVSGVELEVEPVVIGEEAVRMLRERARVVLAQIAHVGWRVEHAHEGRRRLAAGV